MRIDKAKFASEYDAVVGSEIFKVLLDFLEKKRGILLTRILRDKEFSDIQLARGAYEALASIEGRLREPNKFIDDYDREIADTALDNLKSHRGIGGPKA